MAHHLYQTEGIILSDTPIGESNKLYRIFTKDLGLVVATAQGVRELKSKLRYSLQGFSYVYISLVRGKDMWRITNAQKDLSFKNILHTKEKLAVFLNATHLLKKLLAGEEQNRELFYDVMNGILFLEHEDLEREELKNIEIVFALKILSRLGYWGREEFEHLVEIDEWTQGGLRPVTASRKALVKEINSVLRDTHLWNTDVL